MGEEMKGWEKKKGRVKASFEVLSVTLKRSWDDVMERCTSVLGKEGERMTGMQKRLLCSLLFPSLM